MKKQGKKNKIEAVLFDYDGTLVDTESICFKLYPKIFKKLGFKINDSQLLELRSAGYPCREKLLKEWYGVKNPDKIAKKIQKILIKEFWKYIKKEPIKIKPYVIETLKYLTNNNISAYIVTSTDFKDVSKQINDLGFLKYITKIFTVEKVKYGKPEPDVYEYACYHLKLKPENTLAVEDCPNGVIAACKAGCQTVMIPDLTQPDKELKAKYKFKTLKSMKEIKKLI